LPGVSISSSQRLSLFSIRTRTGVTPSRAATMPVSIANGATPARMLPQFGVVSTRPSPTTTCTNR